MNTKTLTSKIVKKELVERLTVVAGLSKIRVDIKDDDWGGYDINLYIPLGGTKQDDKTFKAWNKQISLSANHSYLMKGTDSFDALCDYIVNLLTGVTK